MRLIDAHRTEEKVKISDKPAWMVVRDMPTIDAVEVVHGRWEIDGVYNRCSVCNRLTLMPYLKGLPQFSYCPNCGAKMDFEEVR